MAIFGYNIPPLFFGDFHSTRHHKHQQQHNRHHHHEKESRTDFSSSSGIHVGSSNNNVVGHVHVQQASKSKESKVFIEWVYKYAARISIGGASIGFGIGIGHGSSINGGNQINSGGKDKINGHSSHITEKNIQSTVKYATKITQPTKVTTEPSRGTTTTWEPLPDDDDCETVSPIPEINVENITAAPKLPVSITTEKPEVTPKSTTSTPGQSGSEHQNGHSKTNSHSGSSTQNDDIYGVNHIIESITSQLEQTQAQSLPCPPEQLIIIKTGPVKVEKNTDASTGSTSIVVKPVIVVAPISVASSCGPNCESL